jgi:hypothetical protein
MSHTSVQDFLYIALRILTSFMLLSLVGMLLIWAPRQIPGDASMQASWFSAGKGFCLAAIFGTAFVVVPYSQAYFVLSLPIGSREILQAISIGYLLELVWGVGMQRVDNQRMGVISVEELFSAHIQKIIAHGEVTP